MKYREIEGYALDIAKLDKYWSRAERRTETPDIFFIQGDSPTL